MASTLTVRLAYFGYSVTFQAKAAATADRRAEANALVLARYGAAPAMAYVAPGLPFPDYVPVQVWDAETATFF